MRCLEKIFLSLIIFIVSISPIFAYAAAGVPGPDPTLGNTWGDVSQTPGFSQVSGGIIPTNNRGDILTGGFGIYIKLIKYNNSTKKESIVGKPILLYSGGLLDDITEVDSGAGGASSSGGGGPVNVCVGACGPGSAAYAAFGGNYIIVPGTSVDIPMTGGSLGTDYGQGDGYGGVGTVYSGTLINNNGTWIPGGGFSCSKSSSNVYSAEVISYYKKDHIRFLFEGNIADVSSGNVKSKTSDKNGVRIVKSDVNLKQVTLYNYIKGYILGSDASKYNNDSKLFRDNDGKGKVTISKILSAFSINSSNFNMSELDSYYFSFEPVTREKTGSVVNSWSSSQTSTSTSGASVINYRCSATGEEVAGSPSGACVKPKTCYTDTYRCPCYSSGGVSGAGGGSCTCGGDPYDCSVYGSWSAVSCASYKYTSTSTLITNHAEKHSVIQPARYGSRNEVISTLTTAINLDSQHDVLDKNNRPTGQFEYFIGPNLKTALVGTTTNNKYQLYNGTQAMSSSSAKTNAVGVSYWWLPDLTDCKKECNYSNNSSDDLLICAENYCDNAIGYDERANTQKLKAECITQTCGYTYTPISCSTANPYINDQSVDLGEPQKSVCGMVDGTEELTLDNGKTKVTCTSIDGGTDIFDQKGYINIACKETTAIGFTNLSTKRLVAGQGINYYVDQKGNKECQIFLDLNTWKFAYASYHSQDIINVRDDNGNMTEMSTRNQLLRMLNYFNNASTKEIDSEIGMNLAGEFYTVTWKDLNYDRELDVNSKVTEIVDNVEDESETYKLVETYHNSTSKLDVINNETTKAIARLTSRPVRLNRFLQTSDVARTYTFDKYCVTKDGKATVYDASADGSCRYTPDEFGKNVYYTDLNATANREFIDSSLNHFIETTVDFADEVGDPLLNDESCPYEIDGLDFGCTIDIIPDEGTNMHGNNIYEGGTVTATLLLKDKLGTLDSIESTEIKSGALSSSTELVIGIGDRRNGNEQIDIVGTVKTKNGKTSICKKTIHIIDPDPNCGVACSVDKYQSYEDVYQISSVGRQNPKAYFSATSINFSFVKLSPNVVNNLYLVRVKKRETGFYLYGKVQGSMLNNNSSTCYNLCWIEIPGEDEIEDIKKYNCLLENESADYESIKNYCEANWDKDINNYDSIADCQTRCGRRACPVENRNLDEVDKFCRNNYAELGYASANSCVNYCYYCPECASDFIYRTVNNYNPFPNSSDSNTLGFNYPTGDRVIGTNWVGKTEYIKADDEDSSSVTGIHRNQKVEYEIELTPNDIREIRSDTESYNNSSSGNDAYLDYVYMDGVDETKKYYSKFINETIYDKFTVINGETVR